MVETDNPVTDISERIATLRHKRNKLVHEFEQIQQSFLNQGFELATVDAQISVLEEITGVERSICCTGHVYDAFVNSTGLDCGTVVFSGTMKPTDAVITLLRMQPGLGMRQILDRLECKVESTARDLRHTLRTTVHNLSKAGRVTRLEDNTFQLAEH